MLKRLLLAAVVVSPLSLPSDGVADLQITAMQDGDDVVFSGEGSLELGALQFAGSTSAIRGLIWPAGSFVNFGMNSFSTTADTYAAPIVAPVNFGAGGVSVPDSWSGDIALGADTFNGGRVVVPAGYISGSSLSASMIFNNATIASLGMTPGNYTWSWPDVEVDFDVEGGLSTASDGVICEDRIEFSGLDAITFPDRCIIPGDSITLTVVPEPSAFLYGGLISSIIGCGVWAKRRYVG